RSSSSPPRRRFCIAASDVADRILSAGRLQRLLESQLAIDPASGDVLAEVADQAARILGEAVVVFGRRGGRWTGDAVARGALELASAADLRDALTQAASPAESRTVVWSDADGRAWTFVSAASPPLAIAVGGNWMLSGERLALWARTVAATRRSARRAAA